MALRDKIKEVCLERKESADGRTQGVLRKR